MLKLPNAYGSVVKLQGRRRKKYAVRITTGHKEIVVVPNKAAYYPVAIDKYSMRYRKGKNDYAVDATEAIKEDLSAHMVQFRIEFIQTRKYLAYFEKSKDAYDYLARMNRGDPIKEHVSLSSEPDFKTVYAMYIQFAKSLNKPPSEASLKAYSTGFKLWKDVHDIRFKAVTTKQLQDALTAHGTMSKASVTRMITVLKKMYKYGIAHQICDTDLSPYLFQEHTDEKKIVHTIFTDKEIERLWKTNTEASKVTLLLIYTGLRCSEFLGLKTKDIHLDERYLVGGMKTEAGRNRVIPIHKKIIPLIRRFYNPDSQYLFPSTAGNAMLYSHFRTNKWDVYNKELGLNHLAHDTRHTCATKLEQYGVSDLHRKLILGHSLRDVTAIYTHVSLEALIEDIDRWE